MKKLLPAVLAGFMFSFSGREHPPFIKIDRLNQRMTNGADTTYVVNFWATWCAPCVKELPDFTAFDSIHANDKVKVILISMDFKQDIGTKLVPFIHKRRIKTEVLVLDELYDNEWIPKVDSGWQGNIPVTLIRNVSRNYRKFLPRETTRAELDSLIRTE
ncbi:MAG TPA: TlpA disulfide reductase family protein [Bacteroidia bacterium]|nr:TlpA disulfide reductase family protein [Bacteroidia bacterium]